MRIYTYVRVSSEEQKKYGLSVDAQRENLKKWAAANGHTIIREYNDAGISGKKPISKRPDLQRMLRDMETEKVDMICFTKLDRWFRSVKEYYKTQEVLDRNRVVWKAIEEDYETETASGRFKVNIMLSVAENEADRTGERIKVIQRAKIERGEFITRSIPLGLKPEGKHLVHDPESADAVRAFLLRYKETGSANDARRFLESEYGISVLDVSARHMLRNPLYKGEYRGNRSFCPPLISPEDFDEIQEKLKARAVRHNQTGRVYLFVGLLVCGECGKRMTARYANHTNGEFHSYRCITATQYGKCTHRKHISERALEEWLIAHIESELAGQEQEYELRTTQQKKPKVNRAAIQKKLDRLKDLYVDELITKEQYKADFAKYNAMLAADIKPSAPDFPRYRKIIGEAFQGNYGKWSAQEKQTFWRSIIDRIIVNQENEVTIFFKV